MTQVYIGMAAPGIEATGSYRSPMSLCRSGWRRSLQTERKRSRSDSWWNQPDPKEHREVLPRPDPHSADPVAKSVKKTADGRSPRSGYEESVSIANEVPIALFVHDAASLAWGIFSPIRQDRLSRSSLGRPPQQHQGR